MTDNLPDQTKLSNKWKELYEEGDIETIALRSRLKQEDIREYLKTGKTMNPRVFGAVHNYYQMKAKK